MSEPWERLRDARKRKFGADSTGVEAANALKIPDQTYLAHENGSRGFGKHGRRYAKFFGVDYVWLMTGQGSPGGHPAQQIYDDLPPEVQKEAINFMEFLKNRSR